MHARLKQSANGLEFYSSYDAGLIGELKSRIPPMGRRWDTVKKCWVIDPQYAMLVKNLTYTHLGVVCKTTGIDFTKPHQKQSVTKLFRVEYIGGLKDRGDGELVALGGISHTVKHEIKRAGASTITVSTASGGLDWSIAFSEKVLRLWFEGSEETSIVVTTMYSTLATPPNATGQEIKSAWRKQIRRWHPDINHDADAADMTIKINEAYSILRNPQKRKRYDAGLKLEASLNKPSPVQNYTALSANHWQLPMRCGLILCNGHYQVGRFVVSNILEWKNIIKNGQTLVTSWDLLTSNLIRRWI